MNKNQRMILYIGAGLLVLVSAFPPWRFVSHYAGRTGIERSAGYHFLLNPPKFGSGLTMTPWGDSVDVVDTKLDMPTFLVEWVTLTLVTLALVAAKRSQQ